MVQLRAENTVRLFSNARRAFVQGLIISMVHARDGRKTTSVLG